MNVNELNELHELTKFAHVQLNVNSADLWRETFVVRWCYGSAQPAV